MRRLPIGVVLLIGACDPARVARFEIAPQKQGADSTLRSEAVAIAQKFADRYRMRALPVDELCRIARYASADSVRGREVGLTLCLLPKGAGIEFRVIEAITSSWGPVGNVLKAELADTLTGRFGETVQRR
jgi:hypothetical protein